MNKRPIPNNVSWLPDEDYEKAVGQLRLQMASVFSPFRIHGLDVFIPGAVDEAIKLAEDFGLRVRGIDKVISLDRVRRKNGNRISGTD